MRHVERGEPAFEGFINGKDAPKDAQPRVFIDEDGEPWFEVERGLFAYHSAQTRADAERAYALWGNSVCNTLATLQDDYPNGTLTTDS